MNAHENSSNSQVSERVNPTAPKPTKKPRKQATSVQQKTDVPAAGQVKSDQAHDQKPTTPLTTAQRAEAISHMSPGESAIFGQLVTKLEQGEDPATAQAWYQEQIAALEAAKPTPEPEAVVTPEFAAVDSIARAIIAKLLAGDLGAALFDIENSFSVLEAVYLDICDAITETLPLVDTTQLHKIAVHYSANR